MLLQNDLKDFQYDTGIIHNQRNRNPPKRLYHHYYKFVTFVKIVSIGLSNVDKLLSNTHQINHKIYYENCRALLFLVCKCKRLEHKYMRQRKIIKMSQTP